MFKNTFQSGFLSILYSIGSKPLQIWDKKVRNGHIKRITDPDIQSFVLEIVGTNVSTTYITCPADPRYLTSLGNNEFQTEFCELFLQEDFGHKASLLGNDR